MACPYHVDDFSAKSEAFSDWLTARGAQVLSGTNEYEALRVRAGRQTHVLYQKANGKLTWNKAMRRLWSQFVEGDSPDLSPSGKVGRPSSARRANLINTVLERDGKDCFYCGKILPPDDTTLEHLVPISAGGCNHIGNLVAAHQKCNSEAGHLSVMKKIKMREAKLYGSAE